ncbi:MAG: hypothetical protein ACJ8FK_02120, partial [Xanthobacteraceae bacterium]
MQSLTLQEGIQQRPDLRRTVALARELANESLLLREVILSLGTLPLGVVEMPRQSRAIHGSILQHVCLCQELS